MEADFIRLFFVFISGYFLCLSGSLSQLVTNNTLASPSTLGMDGLAVSMVILSQVLLVSFFPDVALESMAFVIFGVVFIVLWWISKSKEAQMTDIWRGLNIKKVILMGLSFNLFVGAIFSVLLFLFMAMNFEFPSGIWFGNFKQYQTKWLFLFVPLLVVTFIYIYKFSYSLAVLNLGRDFATGLKLDVKKVQNISLFLSLLLTGVVICFFGVFSFLGLILPHILRSFAWFKTDMQKELVQGPLIAGALLSGIDFLCYNFTFMGAELPVGMVSGVIGSFFLIFLISRSKV